MSGERERERVEVAEMTPAETVEEEGRCTERGAHTLPCVSPSPESHRGSGGGGGGIVLRPGLNARVGTALGPEGRVLGE